MKISKLALIALLGGALMAFGCSDDTSNGGGSGGSGGTGGTGGTGGAAPACAPATTTCENGTIDPIVPCCEPDLPPEQENACTGDESLVNPTECTTTENVVIHQLTVMAINGDCNAGYDLDTCDGYSCDKGTLAPDEGLLGVDNAVAGLAPNLETLMANLDGVNQAFADALCGETDSDPDMEGCQQTEISVLDLQFAVDANVEQNCATVELIVGGESAGTVLLNLSDPTEGGTVCASGTIGMIPLEIAGTAGAMGNAVVRMTVSENGFSDGLLGATVDGATAVAIAEAINPVAAGLVAGTFDISSSLTGDSGATCDALSGAYNIGGVALLQQ